MSRKSNPELREKIVAEMRRYAEKVKSGGHYYPKLLAYATWRFPPQIGVSTATARAELKLMELEGLASCDRSQTNNYRWRLAEWEVQS